MNKKGFTLVELLSVIVLIGIVLSIAVLGVSSVRTSILDKQYKNIKTEIELAGEKYYNDTESTKMVEMIHVKIAMIKVFTNIFGKFKILVSVNNFT